MFALPLLTKRQSQPRRTAGGLALVLLVTVVAACSGSGATGVQQTATPTPPRATSTATSTPRGWQVAQGIGTGALPSIAFAPADPATAYACIADSNAAFQVSVSHDAGASWTRTAAPISGAFCLLSSNPDNPRDVVLVNNSSTSAFTLTRSLDGGATWQQQRAGSLAFQALGWVGSTLYVATILTENPVTSKTELWASVRGGPFSERDQNGQLPGMTLGLVSLITGHGSTLFLVNGAGVPASGPTFKSSDGGATWTQVTFHDGGQVVQLVTATPDGRLLAGVYANAPAALALSRDDGTTWQRLAAPPATLTALGDVLLAPDGTVYVTSDRLGSAQNPDTTLYTTTPTASQWSGTAMLPANAFPITVAWDGSGHPTAVWARQALDARATSWQLISESVLPAG
ncbi:MAG TPA: hypothetical protein VGS80_17375 [Ktedonobacterales bacterium]|nr:hypothetical protein [Ktedonobacterales bacterium]